MAIAQLDAFAAGPSAQEPPARQGAPGATVSGHGAGAGRGSGTNRYTVRPPATRKAIEAQNTAS